MGHVMPNYSATIILTEEDLLFLIKTADALDEIGAQEQAGLLTKIAQQFTMVRKS